MALKRMFFSLLFKMEKLQPLKYAMMHHELIYCIFSAVEQQQKSGDKKKSNAENKEGE